jgi:hypothetical protein
MTDGEHNSSSGSPLPECGGECTEEIGDGFLVLCDLFCIGPQDRYL